MSKQRIRVFATYFKNGNTVYHFYDISNGQITDSARRVFIEKHFDCLIRVVRPTVS